MKHLPPLNFLRSFEAAARHLSFTSAAQELNYTQAAISSHVRALEDFIGRPLFHRYPRSLALTEIGAAYLPALRQALEQIDIATASIAANGGARQVMISCPVSLAENWLSKKVAGFRAAHPEIDILIHGTVWQSVGEELVDLQITMHPAGQAEPGGRLLFEESLVMICAPALLSGDAPLRCPQDLHRQTLIKILGRQEYWAVFVDAHGIEELNLEGGIKTDSSNIALELAVHGLGCSVVQRSLAATYVRRGLLVEPFPGPMRSPFAFSLYAHRAGRNKSAALLAAWLLKEEQTLGAA